jgi:hypothetical protein
MEPTQDIREKFGRFRILVVGRANAGKTTLLQRICNTTEKPEIFDREGNKVDLVFHATSASPTDQWRSDRCRRCARLRRRMYAHTLGTDLDFYQRGYHNIEHELVFTSNQGFVFHDSCGFEAGGEEEFTKMKKFVLDRASTTILKERIHAIW